jgi:hypothetical protein
MTVRYYAHVHAAGPVRHGQLPGSIGVLEAPDHPMPTGTAFEAGWTEDGLATWRLTVHGAEVPGRWINVDREFRPVEGDKGLASVAWRRCRGQSSRGRLHR